MCAVTYFIGVAYKMHNKFMEFTATRCGDGCSLRLLETGMGLIHGLSLAASHGGYMEPPGSKAVYP